MKRRVLLVAALVALIAGAAFFGGYQVGARPASPAYKVDVRDRVTVPHPAAPAAYTLRYGDLVTVPAVKLWCDVERVNQFESNGGPWHPIVQCQRTAPTPGQPYVVFRRNRIAVWRAGKTDYPVWGKP